ncbi:hypothetical protein CO058_03275 [candidate division WWE3 bacterium CG_4_9_14_0_2_um_filter_35_11]|uniref:Uncharacterized protein n=1 Tax=candidate division WWE3 bacterium CG_4_9_14_0_2_um_filter_35_11 TaxID=1975077 RepID=A0A2M8ELB0_UNCKA|nr:MAG: hypothetical protein COV25_03765 [candidate division WWE3 bacterium CG10_big_fil_rev_8_21_14_0_10_35_32]PJC23505.1 MAG: hypothetical protein CO058_03275 [candidate division WWE3 bacterium CG_4_9_14_0_2_um_filter_35_11]
MSDKSASIANVFISYNLLGEIQGYTITTYTIYENHPTGVEVLAIDLRSREYHYVYRYKQGIPPEDRVRDLLEVPSRIINTVKLTNWSNPA